MNDMPVTPIEMMKRAEQIASLILTLEIPARFDELIKLKASNEVMYALVKNILKGEAGLSREKD